MHSLEITWLSDDFAEEPELPEPFAWQLHALIASLLSVLAPGLRRLSHSLIPIIFWKDTLLPLVSGGGSKLQVVALRLPSTAGLAALGGSLTELSIDTSESDGAALPDLSATLRRLPLLEDLQLSICETDPGESCSLKSMHAPHSNDHLPPPYGPSCSAHHPQLPHVPHGAAAGWF